MNNEDINRITKILSGLDFTSQYSTDKDSYYCNHGLFTKTKEYISAYELEEYYKALYRDDADTAFIIGIKDTDVYLYDKNYELLHKITFPFKSYYDSRMDLEVDISDIIIELPTVRYARFDANPKYNIAIYVNPQQFSSIHDAKTKITNDNKILLSFKVCLRYLGDLKYYSQRWFLEDNEVNLTKILSDENIKKYEEQKREIHKKRLCSKISELYITGYSDIFNFYESLSDEDKLKLELTGKL